VPQLHQAVIFLAVPLAPTQVAHSTTSTQLSWQCVHLATHTWLSGQQVRLLRGHTHVTQVLVQHVHIVSDIVLLRLAKWGVEFCLLTYLLLPLVTAGMIDSQEGGPFLIEADQGDTISGTMGRDEVADVLVGGGGNGGNRAGRTCVQSPCHTCRTISLSHTVLFLHTIAGGEAEQIQNLRCLMPAPAPTHPLCPPGLCVLYTRGHWEDI
jgi:hypothetical protein